MTESTKKLIFTDLDGTLLDHDDYSWAEAKPALVRALDCSVPVIPCTSKTFDECLVTQQEFGFEGPFIFENGSGIALPKDLFRKPFQQNAAEHGHYWLCSLGVPYPKIQHALLHLRNTKHYQFRSFSDMSATQISDATGLTINSAERAMQRRFSEPLVWLDDAKSFDKFASDINQIGLTLTRGGRFIHVAGNTDKGKAMQWLARRYEYKLGHAPTIIALGDSKNDIPMLQAADIAVIIRPRHANPVQLEQQKPKQKIVTTKLIGPAGWNEAVLSLLNDMETVHG